MKFEFTEENKKEICEKILRALPPWFGIESSILNYIEDAGRMPMIIAKDEAEIIGFVSLNFHNQYTAEVHVMGALPYHHRTGVGAGLIWMAEKFLVEQGYKFLTVKTLSPSAKDENYARTRAFYLGVGFFPVEEFKTLWDEHNPCLLMIKALGS